MDAPGGIIFKLAATIEAQAMTISLSLKEKIGVKELLL
jgi:hypothetical protein